jgi:hypothetical protein
MFAQPREGACFYRNANYVGKPMCVSVGETLDHLGRGYDNSIKSVQVYGRVEVNVFTTVEFGGYSLRIDRSIPDLHGVRLGNEQADWSGRISSIQVNFQHDAFRRGRELRWGHMEVPRAGACFYRNERFGGDYFCLASGESYDALPEGFNDTITSVRVFGGASVVAFNDPGFGGLRIHMRNDVQDLHHFRTQDNPWKNWNNRISSLQVLGAGYGEGRWHPDRDRDEWQHR